MSDTSRFQSIEIYKYHHKFITLLGKSFIPPTHSARLIFLYTSILYNIQAYFANTLESVDNFPRKSIKLENETEFHILCQYALKKLCDKYIPNSGLDTVIVPANCQIAAQSIDEYLDTRHLDGWNNEAEVQLPNNTQTIKIDKKQTSAEFADAEKWTPMQNWKPLGANWKNVVNVLPVQVKKQILYHFYNNINLQSEQVPLADRARQILDLSRTLSDEQKMTAELWAGTTLLSPPSINYAIVTSVFACKHVPLRRACLIYMLLGVALFEASIIAWDIKYNLWQARPIQTIRLYFPDEKIDYYYGKTKCNLWLPYQNVDFITPPFPDSISGHTIFSTVTSLILEKFFGRFILKNAVILEDFLPMISKILEPNYIRKFPVNLNTIVIEKNSSQISSAFPKKDCIFRFKTWMDLAESAGISRIYGGIHYHSSNTDSAQVAKLLVHDIFSFFRIL